MAIVLGDVELARFFLAVALLLIGSHTIGYLFTLLKLPKVIGEIFGGLIFGPTLLGYFFPEIFQKIFLDQGNLLAVLYWLGLCLLMFCSGFEIEPNFDKKDKKITLWLIATSTIIPFIFGWLATSFFDLTQLVGVKKNIIALKLVIAVAIAVTSIPVVSKIFFDLGIIKTKFAKIILATATVHDIVLWVFLAIATGLVTSGNVSTFYITSHVGITILFFIAVILLIPKIVKLFRAKKISPIPKNYEFGFVMAILLLFVVLANYLKVNLVFGAFLAGIIIGLLRNQKFRQIRENIKEIAFAFFVPIYFAIVGIKLDLINSFDIKFFFIFLLFAMVVQGLTVFLTAKSLRYNNLSSFNLAAAMNARGGPGIVLATIAFDVGIISEKFFVTLVMLAIVTSLLAGIWLRYVKSRNMPLLS
jgi:Kef-type K+ transport system membrane component KefB